MVPVDLVPATRILPGVLAGVVVWLEGRLHEADAQPVDGDLEEGDVDDHVMPRERRGAHVGVDDRKHVEDADRREAAHRRPEPHDAHVVQSTWKPEAEAGRHRRAGVFWTNIT